MNIKKGDSVVVISGTSKTFEPHKVLSAMPKSNKVIVEGVNMITRHTKPKKAGEPGGRIEKEAAIDASNVMLYCPNCKHGVRVGFKTEKGKKTRVCVKCNKAI